MSRYHPSGSERAWLAERSARGEMDSAPMRQYIAAGPSEVAPYLGAPNGKGARSPDRFFPAVRGIIFTDLPECGVTGKGFASHDLAQAAAVRVQAHYVRLAGGIELDRAVEAGFVREHMTALASSESGTYRLDRLWHLATCGLTDGEAPDDEDLCEGIAEMIRGKVGVELDLRLKLAGGEVPWEDVGLAFAQAGRLGFLALVATPVTTPGKGRTFSFSWGVTRRTYVYGETIAELTQRAEAFVASSRAIDARRKTAA